MTVHSFSSNVLFFYQNFILVSDCLHSLFFSCSKLEMVKEVYKDDFLLLIESYDKSVMERGDKNSFN